MVVDGRRHLLPANAAKLAATRAVGIRDTVELGRILARIGSIDPASLAVTSVSDWVDTITARPRAAAVRYLDGGWESLVAQLAAVVERAGGHIERGAVVDVLPDAAAVIVAAGGPEVAARLVGRAFDVGPSAEASVLDLALSAPPRRRFVIGVDEARYLSDHGFVRHMTPPGGASVSLGRYLAPDDRPTPDSGRSTLRAFARHAGVTDDAVVDERYLHRMTTVSAIATAQRGGLSGRPPVGVSDRPGVFLAGDWVGSRGHLADAALASAEEAARQAIAHIERTVAA